MAPSSTERARARLADDTAERSCRCRCPPPLAFSLAGAAVAADAAVAAVAAAASGVGEGACGGADGGRSGEAGAEAAFLAAGAAAKMDVWALGEVWHMSSVAAVASCSIAVTGDALGDSMIWGAGRAGRRGEG